MGEARDGQVPDPEQGARQVRVQGPASRVVAEAGEGGGEAGVADPVGGGPPGARWRGGGQGAGQVRPGRGGPVADGGRVEEAGHRGGGHREARVRGQGSEVPAAQGVPGEADAHRPRRIRGLRVPGEIGEVGPDVAREGPGVRGLDEARRRVIREDRVGPPEGPGPEGREARAPGDPHHRHRPKGLDVAAPGGDVGPGRRGSPPRAREDQVGDPGAAGAVAGPRVPERDHRRHRPQVDLGARRHQDLGGPRVRRAVEDRVDLDREHRRSGRRATGTRRPHRVGHHHRLAPGEPGVEVRGHVAQVGLRRPGQHRDDEPRPQDQGHATSPQARRRAGHVPGVGDLPARRRGRRAKRTRRKASGVAAPGPLQPPQPRTSSVAEAGAMVTVPPRQVVVGLAMG